jgi:ankyrin repeat protein
MQLPARPNLRHLRDQARDLVRSGAAESLTAAQFQIARQYDFPSWPKLKLYVEAFEEIGRLKQAIDTNDLARVQELMTRNPGLRRAPLGYGKDGPLTWVAECRIPWEPPSPTRLAMAQWMIDHGSDPNEGGGGPLGRAALNGDRIAMMELLVRNGADVNAIWRGRWPILNSPCEALDPVTMKWLLDHGANPNCQVAAALDDAIGTYVRDPKRLMACIELLLAAGARTRYDVPGVLPLLRGRNDELAALLDADSSLVHRRYPELDCGASGGRMLTLRGATLLHVAAEFDYLEAGRLLLERGADPNARADIAADGVGGQTPLFHSLTHFRANNPPLAQLLRERGADDSIRARVPGHYEHEGELLDASAAEYAALFPLR